MGRDNRHSKSKVVFATTASIALGLVILIVEARRNEGIPHPAPNMSKWAARTEPEVPLLEIKSVVPHGDIYEIKGSAEPGSTVIMNGQSVPILFENSSFRYFVGPLPDGVTILTITVQNEDGGVNTKQLALGNEN
jgi:hypothetical protein